MEPQSHPLFRVALIEPEIPQNTGNIGRTCVALGCELHIVGPTAFEISDKNLKRAGLDYWPHLVWFQHENYDAWKKTLSPDSRLFYFTTKSTKTFFDVHFQRGDWLVFGKETKGLAPEIIQQAGDRAITIPQTGPVRSLNLATAVAIAAYEGLRQLNYSKESR